MNCKYCGAEKLGGTKFCVNCGKRNDDTTNSIIYNRIAENGNDTSDEYKKVEITSDEIPRKSETIDDKHISKRKTIIITVLALTLATVVAIILMILPPKPKASVKSGTYKECINVDFSAKAFIPLGGDNEIYLDKDDAGYEKYNDETINLNQVGRYSYNVYTVNGFGIKSGVVSFEYVMEVPKPEELKVSVQPGTYTDYQTVDIIVSDDSTVYYTLDGTTPSENSGIYQNPIKLDNGVTTIKAMAVNENGTRGNVCEWKYELTLPIPEEVSFSNKGGTYSEEIQLELKQKDGATIYYTVDGTEPTENSMVYENPIEITNGMHTIKTISINEYGMASEVSTQNYIVTYSKYGAYPKTAIADGYYAIVGSSGSLVRYDEELNESEVYDVSGVDSIYSDGSKIFYMASNAIYIFEPSNKTSEKIVDMYVDSFAIANESIYFCSSGTLYVADETGDNIEKVGNFNSSQISGCWDGILYFYDSGKAYRIIEKSKVPENIAELSNSLFFLSANMLYYIDDSNLMCKNIDDDSVNVIKESTYDTYNLDPEFELINTTDKTRIISTFCDDIFVCHNTFYVRVRTEVEIDVYHIITKVTDKDMSNSYQWYAVDINSGKISDANITSTTFSVFDEAIIDENGEKHTVIQ